MILLTGATGQNGAEIARQLAAAGVRFKAMTRDPLAARVKLPQGAELVRGELSDPASLDRAMVGVDALLLLSPVSPDQTELQNNAVAAAARAGVGRIVKFSAMGAAEGSPVSFARWHWRTERAIEDSGIAFTFLRPNSLFQNVLRSAKRIVNDGVLAAALADARVSLVDTRDVAAVAVIALTSDELLHQALDITGPAAVTQSELAEALSSALDRPVRCEAQLPSDAAAELRAAGAPAWAAQAMSDMWAGQRRGDAAAVTAVVPQVLGRPAIGAEEATRHLAAALRTRAIAP